VEERVEPVVEAAIRLPPAERRDELREVADLNDGIGRATVSETADVGEAGVGDVRARRRVLAARDRHLRQVRDQPGEERHRQ
jgi:hypothetical protein